MIWRTGSTLVSPSLSIHSVTTCITANTISLPIEIKKSEHESVETLALIDSGAGRKFINRNYAEQLGLPIQNLKRAIMARNIDGTLNKTRTITSYVDLMVEIDGQIMDEQLLVTGLGNQRIILGFPWLKEYNPDINWKRRIQMENLLRFFLFCFVYLCLFIIFRSESWRCCFDSPLFDSYRCHTIDS